MLGNLFIICLIAICTSLPVNASVICNPTKGSVVIEAESTYDTNFLYGPQLDKPGTEGCISRGYLNLNVTTPPDKGGPWYARWIFHVPADGAYYIWLLDNPFAGKMKWQLNNSPFIDRKNEEEIKTGISSPYDMHTWRRITAAPVQLIKSNNPQKFGIQVEMDGPRAGCFMDAIAIVPVGRTPDGWVKQIEDPVTSSNPTLTIAPMSSIPTIDGIKEPDIWDKAASVNLVHSVTAAKTKNATKAWIGYRKEGLYIFAECKMANPQKLIAKITNHDGNVWEDDCFEVFWGKPDSDFGHMIINSKGVIYDERGSDGKLWDSDAKVSTKTTDFGWTIEAFIPAKPMKFDDLSADQSFIFNLAREDVETGEISGWSPTGGSLLDRDLFGTLKLAQNVPVESSIRLFGTVKDEKASPVGLARISCGSLITQSGADGVFLLDGTGQTETTATCFLSGHIGQKQPADPGKAASFLLRRKSNYGVTYEPSFSESETYRVISVPLDAKVNGDYRPSPETWETPAQARVYAAKGQAQPFSLAVYAKQDLQNVKISVSPLRSSNGKLLPTPDIRLVRIWIKRKGYDTNAPSDPIPELLDPAQPVDIASGNFRQIWVTVTPPDNAVSGVYKGSLTITPQQGKLAIVPLEVTVLPFKLQEPKNKLLGVFHYGKAGNWWMFNPTTTFEQYDAQYADMHAHGVRGMFFCDGPEFVIRDKGKLTVYWGFEGSRSATPEEEKKYQGLAEGEIAVDTTYLMQVFDKAHKYGVDHLMIYCQGPRRPIASLTGVPMEEIGWHGRCNLNSKFEELLTRTVKTINKAVAEKGYKPIRYAMDDEVYWGGEYRMSGYMRLARIVKAVGGLQTVTMSYTQDKSELDELRTVLDMPVGTGPFKLAKANDTGSWKGKLSSYGQIWPPSFSGLRMTTGLPFYFSPYASFFGHCYQGSVKDPFNDFDGTTPDMNVTYPDPVTGKPVPTLQWEGFRQGFYDICYLQTLKNRISQTKGKMSEKYKRAWSKILGMVNKYADAEGNLDSISTMPQNEVEQIRKIAVDVLSL